MPRVCGSLGITDSTAHTISRLECGCATAKFIPKHDNQCHVNNGIMKTGPIPSEL
jgi:F0F1-type ATP synthase epsilon subunit